MIYIYNALSILVVGLIFNKKLTNVNRKKKFLMFAFLQMFIIQAIRSPEVGTDALHTVTVYNGFQHSDYFSFLFTHFEPGFRYLLQTLSTLGMHEQWVLVAVSAVTMLGFAVFIYKNVDNPFISTFIFASMFYPSSFNTMRQYMAIAIAINSFTFLRERKCVKSVVMILIGSLIHSTVILMILPILFQQVKNWKNISRLIIAASAVFFLIGDEIIEAILPMLGKSFYLIGFEATRYFRMTTALTVLFAVLIIYLTRNIYDVQAKKIMSLLMCIASVNTVFGVMYLKYEFFSRVIDIINLFLLVSIPTGLEYAKTKYKPLIKLGVYVLPFLLMLNIVYNSMAGIAEYKVFWVR